MTIFQPGQCFFFYSSVSVWHITFSLLSTTMNNVDFCPPISLAIITLCCFSFLLLPFYQFTVILIALFTSDWKSFHF